MLFLDYFLEYNRYMNLLGIMFIVVVAFLFSNNRSRINYKLVAKAFGLHLVFAWVMLKTCWGTWFMGRFAHVIEELYHAADEGIRFLFGALGVAQAPWGFVFAFKVLPIIIFFGAIMSLLFHLGVVQFFVRMLARVFQPILGTSGAETLCAIANSFLGQTEAPLLIRHYLERMTKSEVFLIMVGGMGHISGSILAVYAAMGVPAVHLLSASLMALPATILVAKMLCPETEVAETAGGEMAPLEVKTSNALEAIASGTSDGLHLALNVAAMLVAFIALIATLNMLLGWMCGNVNWILAAVGMDREVPILSLQEIFGVLFAPIGWLLGFVGDEVMRAGELIGIKVAVNEMIAYSTMLTMHLSDRAVILLTYALCGFSNFSSIGIQIGGIGALAPSKRKLLSSFGFKAVMGGVMVNLLSAFVAGLFI